MRTAITFILVLLSLSNLFAQDNNFFWNAASIINDKDGFTYLRDKPDVKSTTNGMARNGDVFWASVDSEPINSMAEVWYNIELRPAPEGYWRSLDTAKIGVKYMYTSRIMPFSKLNRLTSWTALNDGGLELNNDSITVTILVKPFDRSNHKIEYYEDGWLNTIDGVRPWGVEGKLPKYELKSISIQKHDGRGVFKQYNFPLSALSNVYEPNLADGYTGVFFGLHGEMFIIMNNGDGAGGYTVCWTIKKDMTLRSMNFMRLF